MDPLSVVGAVGAIVGAATRSINSLCQLQKQWSGIDLTVSLLAGQLSSINAALNRIFEWMSRNLETIPQHHQLTIDLETSLESCRVLMLFLEGHLSRLEWNDTKTVPLKNKFGAVLKDQTSTDCMNRLHGQTTALNFLLSALNW